MPRLALLCLLLFPWGSLSAQERPTHDVLLYHDSTIARGTVFEVEANGTTRIATTDGRKRIALWSEIRKRVLIPAQLPDSLLTVDHLLFLHSLGDGDREEDVLILNDERFLRGTLLRPPKKGPARFWTSNNSYLEVPAEKIVSTLRLPISTTDSTIDVYYIHPTRELLADNYRILIIEGGVNIGVGEFGSPGDELLMKGGVGFSAGVHASIRIIPKWRWATSIYYSRSELNFSAALEDLWVFADLPPQQNLWALTGVEFRTEGTSPWKLLVSLQAGVVNSTLKGFDFTTRPFPGLGIDTGTQSGSSGSGFAIGAGVGVALGQFSLITRLLSGSVHQEYQTITISEFYPPLVWKFNGDQKITLVQMTLGFSPF